MGSSSVWLGTRELDGRLGRTSISSAQPRGVLTDALSFEHLVGEIETVGEARMKIAVATLAVGSRYQGAVRLGIKSKVHYCRRHGYEFIYREAPYTDRQPSWDKIPLLSENIDRFEVIFWSDADVLIVNPARRLEDIIGMFDLAENKAILIARDSADNVNAGNFFMFNRPSAQELLMKIWQQDQFIHHEWMENQAIIHLLETDPKFASAVHIEERAPNIFNAYCHVGEPARNYRSGDLLLHFAGVRDPEKIEEMMKHHYLHTRKGVDLTRVLLALHNYIPPRLASLRRALQKT
jgi:hypothetical protein